MGPAEANDGTRAADHCSADVVEQVLAGRVDQLGLGPRAVVGPEDDVPDLSVLSDGLLAVGPRLGRDRDGVSVLVGDGERARRIEADALDERLVDGRLAQHILARLADAVPDCGRSVHTTVSSRSAFASPARSPHIERAAPETMIEGSLWVDDCSKMFESWSSRQVVEAYVDSATTSPVELTSAARADPVPLHVQPNNRAGRRGEEPASGAVH